MKIKKHKINYKNFKKVILGLGLLKAGIYDYNEVSTDINIHEMENRFKKAFNLIKRYHKKNRSIIFYGIPIQNIEHKIFKFSQHYFIPESTWSRGLLTNMSHVKKKIKTKKIDKGIVKYLSKFLKSKKVSLVVVFSIEHNFEVIRECYKKRLPLVTFRFRNTPFSTGEWDFSNYKIVGNFDFFDPEISTFIQKLIFALLKKQNK